MVKIASLLFGAIALVLLVTLIALVTVDLGIFKNTIVGFASDYLQREISIKGSLSIDVGRKVHASAEGVRVASEDWTEAADLVTIESVELTVDTWSLLKGIALLDDFHASGIRAHLALDDAGNANWTFAGLETDDVESDDKEATPVVIRQAAVDGTYGEFDLDLNGRLSDLQMPDVLDVVLHAEGSDLGTIAALAGQSGFPEQPFSVDAKFGLDGEALNVEQFLFDLGAAKVQATASRRWVRRH